MLELVPPPSSSPYPYSKQPLFLALPADSLFMRVGAKQATKKRPSPAKNLFTVSLLSW